ncbi:hypothetical protein ACFFON_15435 [Arthrobacter citreus]|uniref:hypothetical protein n=1 Tax=Arthrobacter TaxID=1663 RepID=UPI001265933D|nr:hypothetical protein [Arthrobacter gandavensis]
MPRKTIHGIDLTAPGGLEALFAFRRAQFGDAMMMADGGDGGEGGDGAGAGAGDGDGDAAAAAAAAAAADAAKGATAWDGKIESLPADAQKVIADLRKEAGDERIAAKTLAAIQKALNPDAKDEKPDAAALTKALNDREADAKQAKTELAVYRLAGKNGADPDALLDSRGFLAKLADIDPSDTAKVTKAITDAVKDNPKLKAVLAAGASGADLSGGSGEKRNRSNVTLDSALSTHYGK